MNYVAAVERLVVEEPQIVYVFAATSDGAIVGEAGDRSLLPHEGVVDTTQQSDVIRAFDEQIHQYRAKGPDFVPRTYAQGRSLGVIDSPAPGVVVFAFGVEPEHVAVSTSTERARWMNDFRMRVKSAMGNFLEEKLQ